MLQYFVKSYFSSTIYCYLLFSVPETVEDETVGCLHFADEFSSRYGPIHPEFFPGTLDEAIKEACMKPAREVIIYYVFL